MLKYTMVYCVKRERGAKMVNILEVLSGSLAEKAGIKARDALVSINGSEINDVLDYQYYLKDDDSRLSFLHENS